MEEQVRSVPYNNDAEMYVLGSVLLENNVMNQLLGKLFPEDFFNAQNRTIYTICRYVQELAQEFHSFYNANRVICDDKELMKSRLALMVAIKTTLKNALDILAVSAPERM